MESHRLRVAATAAAGPSRTSSGERSSSVSSGRTSRATAASLRTGSARGSACAASVLDGYAAGGAPVATASGSGLGASVSISPPSVESAWSRRRSIARASLASAVRSSSAVASHARACSSAASTIRDACRCALPRHIRACSSPDLMIRMTARSPSRSRSASAVASASACSSSRTVACASSQASAAACSTASTSALSKPRNARVKTWRRTSSPGFRMGCSSSGATTRSLSGRARSVTTPAGRRQGGSRAPSPLPGVIVCRGATFRARRDDRRVRQPVFTSGARSPSPCAPATRTRSPRAHRICPSVARSIRHVTVFAFPAIVTVIGELGANAAKSK